MSIERFSTSPARKSACVDELPEPGSCGVSAEGGEPDETDGRKRPHRAGGHRSGRHRALGRPNAAMPDATRGVSMTVVSLLHVERQESRAGDRVRRGDVPFTERGAAERHELPPPSGPIRSRPAPTAAATAGTRRRRRRPSPARGASRTARLFLRALLSARTICATPCVCCDAAAPPAAPTAPDGRRRPP